MYIFACCILLMDLASGLCHYCTVGLQTNFSIYTFQVDALTQSLRLQNEWDRCPRRSLQCLLSCLYDVVWRQQAVQDDSMEAAAAPPPLCGNPLSRVFMFVCGPNKSMFCTYEKPYNISTYFIEQKQNRRVSRPRQSTHLSPPDVRSGL